MQRLLLLVVLLALPSLAVAQTAVDDGDYFDISRMNTRAVGYFKTFFVEETTSLRQALDAGVVAEETAVLVTETAAGPLALLTAQMWFHHIAQGEAGGEPWLASF